MKTLFKIFLGLVLLVVIALGAGYFFVTRPAFQKKFIEDKLPAGSSLKHVQVTSGSVEMVELKLLLEDGTTVKVGRLNSGFSPLAAVFDHTIQLRGLELDGLLVELPEAIPATDVPVEEPIGEVVISEASKPKEKPMATRGDTAPADALYTLGQIDWLFDINSINLNGVFVDPAKNRYSLSIASGQVAPGVESELEASLKLESSQAMQGGLKDFSSDIRVLLTQNSNGGFEKLNITSQTQGSDASGSNLLSATQTLNLTIDSFGESAQISLGFNADLLRPELFAHELEAIEGLSIQGNLKAAADGDVLILTTADLDAASKGANVVSIKLKQSLTLGAEQKFSGELMDADLMNLPMAWINPWLGDHTQLSGEPLSAQIALSGQSDGGLQLVTRQPIVIGPISMMKGGYPLLDNVIIRMNPVFRVDANGKFSYDLGEFELLDRYGDVVVGTVSGSKVESDDSSPFAGLQTKARLRVGLAELFNQPALAGKASILAGQATIHLDLDGAAEYPAKLQAAVSGLRARGMPGSRQDYRLAAQLKQSTNGVFLLGSNLEAGSESRASTSMQLAGQVNPGQQPLPFKVTLNSSKITHRDIELLIAAFQPNEPDQPQTTVSTVPNESTRSGSTARAESGTTVVHNRPPWADLDGEIEIKVDSLLLASSQAIKGLTAKAKVSEPEFLLETIKASFEQGGLEGRAKVNYDPRAANAYNVALNLVLDNVDPSAFSKKPSSSFPVKSLFNGAFNIEGHGATLEAAADDSEGELTLSARDGILTAFELDNRSQLGLIGIGLLGQQLDRPGMTAMSKAIPYFKDMYFEDFTLKLTRGQDKKVRIPELSFIGDNVRINGQGIIAASGLSEVLDQPLSMSLGLGVKGRLIDYLETLQLLGPNISEDGFREWKQSIEIGGTLGDPDTSALQKILSDAASRAINDSGKETAQQANNNESQMEGALEQMILPEQGQTQVVEQTEPPKKSKEEKILDDIQMGLDLFNSVLGN